MNVGNLLELERGFHAQGVIQPPADEEHILLREKPRRQLLDVGHILEDFLRLFRQGDKFGKTCVIFRLRKLSLDQRHVQRDHIEAKHLRGISLG